MDFQSANFDLAGIARLPEVVVYIDADYRGAEYRTNLGVSFPQDHPFNDSISSVIVVSGTWDFFEDGNWSGRKITLGPGYYRSTRDLGMHDNISSFLPIAP